MIDKFDKNNTIRNNQIKYLELPKFEIIELPDNYNDFIEKYICANCTNCKQNRIKYLICLICGAKICNDKQCTVKYKGQDWISILIHSKFCSDCQGLFITSESNITLKKDVIKPKNINNYIYLIFFFIFQNQLIS